mmetsp:Transcript_26253/g.36573  ORF Transcript_26253/g.36573 Transcript_26253/m.36573 type:complete len:505 (+) Transcript_26253:57-1571(+)
MSAPAAAASSCSLPDPQTRPSYSKNSHKPGSVSSSVRCGASTTSSDAGRSRSASVSPREGRICGLPGSGVEAAQATERGSAGAENVEGETSVLKWIKYIDEGTLCAYWFNASSGETTWSQPKELYVSHQSTLSFQPIKKSRSTDGGFHKLASDLNRPIARGKAIRRGKSDVGKKISKVVVQRKRKETGSKCGNVKPRSINVTAVAETEQHHKNRSRQPDLKVQAVNRKEIADAGDPSSNESDNQPGILNLELPKMSTNCLSSPSSVMGGLTPRLPDDATTQPRHSKDDWSVASPESDNAWAVEAIDNLCQKVEGEDANSSGERSSRQSSFIGSPIIASSFPDEFLASDSEQLKEQALDLDDKAHGKKSNVSQQPEADPTTKVKHSKHKHVGGEAEKKSKRQRRSPILSSRVAKEAGIHTAANRNSEREKIPDLAVGLSLLLGCALATICSWRFELGVGIAIGFVIGSFCKSTFQLPQKIGMVSLLERIGEIRPKEDSQSYNLAK